MMIKSKMLYETDEEYRQGCGDYDYGTNAPFCDHLTHERISLDVASSVEYIGRLSPMRQTPAEGDDGGVCLVF